MLELTPLEERTGLLSELGKGVVAIKGIEKYRVFPCYDPEYPEDVYLCIEYLINNKLQTVIHERYSEELANKRLEMLRKKGFRLREVKTPAVCYHWV